MVKQEASTFEFSVQVWILLYSLELYTINNIIILNYSLKRFYIHYLQMNNLFIINEYYTNGYLSHMLTLLSVLAIISGIFTIITKNPIVSILFLIGLFASISSYLILIGLSFIGLSYLIVYIGAVSILFLFILMLINIRISELQSNTKNSIFLAIIITIFFNYILFQILPYSIIITNSYNIFIKNILYNFSWNEFHHFFINLKTNKPDILFVTSKFEMQIY
jgi:NADH-ubiquinone oxidoreductase chain 6